MASINGLLKKLFGSKADRDMKEIKPILDKVLAAYGRIDKLSDDGLRKETDRIKEIIHNKIAADEDRKKSLRAQLEDVSIAVEQKEALATEVDKLTKKIDEEIEEVLNEVLPDAFAVMKSTARRFKEKEVIEVTATDMDREFSARHDYVKIEGDKAYWSHTWLAGGNPVTWDMVHYDVQLIGGIVLHRARSQRWPQVRERHWWRPFRCSSMPLQERECMWSLSTITCPSETPSGWALCISSMV